jgi:hypothetical protein
MQVGRHPAARPQGHELQREQPLRTQAARVIHADSRIGIGINYIAACGTFCFAGSSSMAA